MPVYTYRREDGTTFDVRQSFHDSALTVDPQTGQKVVRVVQNAGIIFKGSGFYVNDSKKASKSSLSSTSNGNGNGNGTGKDSGSSDGSIPAGSDASATPDTKTAEAPASETTPAKVKELSPIPQAPKS